MRTELNITPDWVETWTAKEAEAELDLHPAFKFSGPGWYIFRDPKKKSSVDYILVVPCGVNATPWKHTWATQQRFHFLVFNRNPMESFYAIVNAPIRIAEQEVARQ